MNTRTFILRIFFFFILAVALQSKVFAFLPSGDDPQKVKYVFLFIGDGMGQAQVSTAEAYRAALQDKIGFEPLSFTRFPYTGQSTTYANNRLITGSAAAGTALATGRKTNINRISMDPAGNIPYESVAEKAKKEGYKIGIVTSVSIDHATPAVFYAHQPDRDMYFEIGIELALSGFDYFAGGGFLLPEGTYQGQTVNLLQFVADHGYQVVNTAEAFNSLAPGSGKTLVISPRAASGAALPFAMDMHPSDLTLADFTARGITMLSGEEGFFMMVEGGKIDWACHSNDAAATVHEVIAFDKAVEQALAFYFKHPGETLIIVTADHETGGMALGNAKMKYETNIGLLKYQKSSVDELNKIVRQFRISKSGDPEADFNRMLKVLQNDLGLNSERFGTLLSEEETAVLRDIFTESMSDISTGNSKKENYEPFMSKAMEIMNQKAGISWGSTSHTGVNVPVYAIGAGAEKFTGVIDNTDIPRLIGELMWVW
jgi:alkaline phosphatase